MRFGFIVGVLSVLSAWFASPLRAADDATVDIMPLLPGVWLHRSYHKFENGLRYGSNGLIVDQGDGLLLIDTAWGPEKTRTLLANITATTGKPVTAAVVTHAHDDRLGGADILKAEGIKVYAHPETIRLAPLEGNPVPDVALSLSLAPGSTVRLGSVEVVFAGAGHAPDNIVVWLPDQKILFGGCLIRALADTKIGYVGDADIPAWPKTAALLEARYADARLVVPGHGRVGSAVLVSHTQMLAEALLAPQVDGGEGQP